MPSRASDWYELSLKDRLTADDIAHITKRLEGMGDWAPKALELIERYPGVVSTELAEKIGMERFAFKAHVRRLKRLGLTHSLEVGYRLSPRGRAYRDAT